MKNFLKSGFVAMVLACLLASCSSDAPLEAPSNNYEIDLSLSLETDWVFADEILDLINEYRIAEGLSVIEKNKQHASAYATDHTNFMIDQNRICHDNFSFRSAAMKDRGALSVGEIVAYGYTTADEVVNAWLNSPSHLNSIKGNYNKAGFGVLKNEEGNYFFSVLFYKM